MISIYEWLPQSPQAIVYQPWTDPRSG